MPALALRRNVVAPFAIAAILTFALSFAARDAAAANQSVSISNFAFGPASVTVAVGETVTWTNNDAGIPHTASSDTPGVFDSGNMNSGVTFAKTFTAPGSFAYHCNIHTSMTGTVVVTGAAAATSTAPAATATTAAPTATTAAATATAAAPTATTAAAATATLPAPPATSAAVSPTSAVSPAGSPTSAPQPPATGDGDDDGGGAAPLIVGAGVAILVVAGAGTAYAIRQRRGQV